MVESLSAHDLCSREGAVLGRHGSFLYWLLHRIALAVGRCELLPHQRNAMRVLISIINDIILLIQGTIHHLLIVFKILHLIRRIALRHMVSHQSVQIAFPFSSSTPGFII